MNTDWLVLGYRLLIVRGILGIIFGVVAMAWPVETIVVLAVLWGIWALVDGIGAIVQAFSPETTVGRVWLVVMGAVGIIAGLFGMFSPQLAATVLTWVLGIWLVVRGLFELFGAFSSSREAPRWLLVTGGGLSVVLGALFVANPGASAVAIAFWLGLVALAWGIVLLVVGFVVRHELHGTAGQGAVPA
ncbi:MAG TPA: HdeD family acid-resistance protein [Nocardioidaceae bacterium]|jgi:uncharacterized membrane protein HdeD (DUF308 family)|nr:HdeD family acid-resistance protein [Nocardioidaceae bacterium]